MTDAPVEAVGTACVDGHALSAADVDRLRRSFALRAGERRRAVYAVAAAAVNAAECREFFEMLGIDRAQVAEARHPSRLVG